MENTRKLKALWNSGNQHNYGYVEVHCENDYTTEKDAKRVNLCLTACEHIPTERLEASGKGELKTALDSLCFEIETLKQQREMLLGTLEEALEAGNDGDWQSARKAMRIAIAAVKEEEE